MRNTEVTRGCAAYRPADLCTCVVKLTPFFLVSAVLTGDGYQAKRQVSVATFHRWQTEKEIDHQMLTWLRCDKDEPKKYVERRLVDDLKIKSAG